MAYKKKKFFLIKIIFFITLGLIFGLLSGFVLTKEIPTVDSLAYNLPMETTKIYGSDGSLLQEYGAEKRIIVPFNEISPKFFDALIAIEDQNFYRHHGISIKGIIRAAIKNLIRRRTSQGGSTITMQLARQYFLTPEKTISRKIKEIILSLKIERAFTKQQILEMYANKVCFGNGYYGIEAASRYYFGKRAINLETDEAAFLAGIIQRPTYYSPKKYPQRAKERRDLVLYMMFKTNKISKEEYEKFKNKPLKIIKAPVEKGFAAYPSERIRIYLESKFSDEEIYEKGLRVFTTIDPKLQLWAQKAIQNGLREYQRRRPYRGPKRGEEKKVPSSFEEIEEGLSYYAKVESVEKDRIVASFCNERITLTKENFKWYPSITPHLIFKPEDYILLSVQKKEPLEVQLDDTWEAQGALVSFNVKTGEVYALVGGSDFSETMFNRAVQAKRQTGSAVKPLIYAVAFRDGKNISDTEIDTPTLFLYGSEKPEEICYKGYIPQNFEKGFLGTITLRHALEHSVNICAVRLLNQIGYKNVIDFMRKLHISTDLKPYPSMALGAFEITLWELTGAFGAFANNGTYVSPYLIKKIEDRDGRLLESFNPVYEKVLDEDSNFILISALRGVIKRGTAAKAASMKGDFAGKTGTTDDYTDAWFIGFNPNIVTGVWVGRDDHKSLGPLETGAKAALPIWMNFMEKATEGQENIKFTSSDNIIYIPICKDTGKRVGLDSPCTDILEEPFIKGREPQSVCTEKDHFKLLLPHFLQRYELVSNNTVIIPSLDLEDLVRNYPSIVEKISHEKIKINWGGKSFILSVENMVRDELPPPQAFYKNLPPEGAIRCGAEVKYVSK